MALVNCVICNKEFNSGRGSPKACPDCQYEYATLKNGGVNTCAEKGIKLFHIWEDDEESGIKEVVEFIEEVM